MNNIFRYAGYIKVNAYIMYSNKAIALLVIYFNESVYYVTNKKRTHLLTLEKKRK